MKSSLGLPLFILSVYASLGLYSESSKNTAYAQTDYSMINARDTRHINSCGSCHLPYSPGLLPMQSWTKIMTGLENHFGSKVELDQQISTHILAYFEKYALRDGQETVMGQLAKNLPTTPLLRITELPVFIELHSEAIGLMTIEEQELRPISDCANCHRAAASHIFDKSLLSIGHGDGRLSDYK